MATATMNGEASKTAVRQTAKAASPSGTVAVEIPAMEIKQIKIRLVGTSPLLVHAWSEKAKRQMLSKQMKEAKQPKEAKSPEHDFCESLYWLTPKPKVLDARAVKGAKFGFPTIAFKAAAVDACSSVDGITKVQARGAFHVEGQLVLIEDHKGRPAVPVMDQQMVRVGMGTADIRYRGRFDEWSVELTVRYNSRVLKADQIVNLFNVGGFAVGAGEHRPEKNGSLGMFQVG